MSKPLRNIVFLGPDGAGKTTIIELVEIGLARQDIDFAKYYFAPGFFRRYRPKETVSITTNPHEGRQYCAFLVFTKILLMLFEFRMGLPKAKLAHEVSLFDRYIHDLLVDPKRYRMQRTRWWMRVMLKFAPTPDLCIAIIAPVSVIQARKQEVPVEETARQIEAYKAVLRLVPHAILVENVGPPEALASMIIDKIGKK